MTIILGIDNGLAGAIATIDTDTGLRTVRDTPAGGGVYLVGEMANMLREYGEQRLNDSQVRCFIETAQAMPGQGVSSTFKIGLGHGTWRGILAALRIPYVLVSPAVWKGAMGVQAPKGSTGTQRKHIAVAKAQQMFPELAEQLLVSKDGRSEALLIAAYGLRTIGQEQ